MNKYIFMLVCMMFLCSCSEEKHAPVTDDSSIPGQVTNVRVDPLPGAVKLTYDLPAGQNLLYVKAECLINGVMRQVKATPYVNNLTIEGFADTQTYTVNLYSVNRSEKVSEPVEKQVKPLSPNFREVFKNIQLQEDWGGVSVLFENPNEADLAIIMNYVDNDGFWDHGETFYTQSLTGKVTLRGLPPKEIKIGVCVRDRWGNLSDTLIRDLTPRFEKELDRSKFRGMYLPGDASIVAGWGFELWWDLNVLGDQGLATVNDGTWPPTVTFDMGTPQGALISRMKLWQRVHSVYEQQAYGDRYIRKFEVWGSMNPDLDGSWDSWTLLLDGEMIKPSGLPVGTNSAEDIEAFYNGNDVSDFPLDIPYVRYIRFKCKELWGGMRTQFISSAMCLWGQEPSDIED